MTGRCRTSSSRFSVEADSQKSRILRAAFAWGESTAALLSRKSELDEPGCAVSLLPRYDRCGLELTLGPVEETGEALHVG